MGNNLPAWFGSEPDYGRIHLGWTQDVRGAVKRVFDDSGKSLLMVGYTGNGKATDVLIPSVLTYNGGIFAIDPKLEMAAVCRTARRYLGNFYVMNPCNMLAHITALKTSYFNPIARTPRTKEAVNERANSCAGAIIMKHPGVNAWVTDGAHILIVAELEDLLLRWNEAAQLAARGGEIREPNLHDLRRRVMLNGDQLKEHMEDMRDNSPSDNAQAIGSIYANPENCTGRGSAATIRSDAQNQLNDLLKHYGIARVLAGNPAKGYDSDFRFEDQNRPGCMDAIFLGLPDQAAQDNPRFTRLLVACAMNAYMREGRSQQKLFVCDEAGTSMGNSELAALEVAVNKGRGYGLTCAVVLQTWGQGKKIFSDPETVASGCAAEMYLGVNDLTTAERLQERSGLKQVRYYTQSYSSGTTGRGESTSGMSSSEQVKDMPLFNKVKLYDMGQDVCVVFKVGMAAPLVLRRMPYYEGWRFPQSAHWPKLAMPNPYAPGYSPDDEPPGEVELLPPAANDEPAPVDVTPAPAQPLEPKDESAPATIAPLAAQEPVAPPALAPHVLAVRRKIDDEARAARHAAAALRKMRGEPGAKTDL